MGQRQVFGKPVARVKLRGVEDETGFFSEAMKIPSLFAGAIKATQREATAYGCERMDPSRNVVLIIDSRNRLPREA